MFIYKITQSGSELIFQAGEATCQGCNRTWAINASRQSAHIEKCPGALEKLRRASKTVQTTLSLGKLTTATNKANIMEALAEAIFMNNRPFSLFEQPAMRKFIQLLAPTYTPPDRHYISDVLLPQYYTTLECRFFEELRRIRYLNISVDESTNINNERVFVMTITTPTKSWFYSLQNMGSLKLDAVTIVEVIMKQLLRLQKDLQDGEIDWANINSISTDTCNTMRAAWRLLSQKPQLQHVFMIPCDSHGLQLIFKDLIGNESRFPMIKNTFKSALQIVTFFHKSPLQYAYLQKLQEEHYSHRKALIASVITRWGSQYNLILSVNNSRKALVDWAHSVSNQDTAKIVEVIGTILDKSFWTLLEELCDIFQPLHIMQKASEASNAGIMEVAERWCKLQKLMPEKARFTGFSQEINEYFTGDGFKSRERRQILPIHRVAYFLNPTTINEDLGPYTHDIRPILEAQKSRDGKVSAWKEFLFFRQQDDVFWKASCWKEKEDIPTFWSEAVSANNLILYQSNRYYF
jgi:hypothetical protein